jgi:hypothetical protein
MPDLTQVLNQKLPEWISAFGAIASMVGVWLVWGQIKLTKKITLLQFEDGLAKEYRDLASRIPTKALLGSGLSPDEFEKAFDELFRYIDLSNEQVALRQHDRVSDDTWVSWSDGIKFNMGLPAFDRAWTEMESKAPTQFSELRRFLSPACSADPKEWKKADCQ